MQIHVDNIKCGGCRNSIVKGLSALPDVHRVDVDVAQGQIRLQAPTTVSRCSCYDV